MTESPIDEITRILATWPAEPRAAGVLRVVRAMQERIDLAEARVAELREAAAEYVAMMEPAPGESPLGPVTATVHRGLVDALSALDAPPATQNREGR